MKDPFQVARETLTPDEERRYRAWYERFVIGERNAGRTNPLNFEEWLYQRVRARSMAV